MLRINIYKVSNAGDDMTKTPSIRHCREYKSRKLQRSAQHNYIITNQGGIIVNTSTADFHAYTHCYIFTVILLSSYI